MYYLFFTVHHRSFEKLSEMLVNNCRLCIQSNYVYLSLSFSTLVVLLGRWELNEVWTIDSNTFVIEFDSSFVES